MKTQIAILYADRQFTPWKENIDSATIKNVLDHINDDYLVTIVHMTEPNQELAQLLKSFKFIVNLCYGYLSYSQADIAIWLDNHEIPHLSTSGSVQNIVQDKLLTEQLLIDESFPSVKSLFSVSEVANSDFDYFIIKPRFGGCHRGITTIPKEELLSLFGEINLQEQLIQPYLFGREFSVAIIPSEFGNDYIALDPVEIIPYPPRDVFIAGQQYGITTKEFKINLERSKLNELKQLAQSTHRHLNLRYISRIDFRMYDNEFYILDVNSMPNLHPQHSLLPSILASINLPFSELMKRMFQMFQTKYYQDENQYLHG